MIDKYAVGLFKNNLIVFNENNITVLSKMAEGTKWYM